MLYEGLVEVGLKSFILRNNPAFVFNVDLYDIGFTDVT